MSEGRYEGRENFEWLANGRHMRLLNRFAYVDPIEIRWEVPRGAVVDGASIPRVLWTLIGGPFEGKYRTASVVHDWYCDLRSRPWKQVHRMFFDAMITSLVPVAQARLLYAGVYLGGPRWSKTVEENIVLAITRRQPMRKRGRGMAGMDMDGPDDDEGEGAGLNPASSRTIIKAITTLETYPMSLADLRWLEGTVEEDASRNLDSIDLMVDGRLASRAPRVSTERTREVRNITRL
jgi:hypothetical protein